jgi:hypothetical protein
MKPQKTVLKKKNADGTRDGTNHCRHVRPLAPRLISADVGRRGRSCSGRGVRLSGLMVTGSVRSQRGLFDDEAVDAAGGRARTLQTRMVGR